ncbi:hypothetical protein Gotur_025708 [Gossypium turneri]
MELEEFPSHIIEKIKYTWETWNSPPRLSSDSLHLDEIEEMNLNKKAWRSGSHHDGSNH